LIGLVDKLVRHITCDAIGLGLMGIGNNDSADDMKNVDLTRIHYLSGPFEIETAEPGDVLVVEICDVQPHEAHPW
jgi:acetamidase/formamidase